MVTFLKTAITAQIAYPVGLPLKLIELPSPDCRKPYAKKLPGLPLSVPILVMVMPEKVGVFVMMYCDVQFTTTRSPTCTDGDISPILKDISPKLLVAVLVCAPMNSGLLDAP